MQKITSHLQWMVVQSVAERLTLWFRNNFMKVNPDKFHLVLSDEKVIRYIFVIKSFQVHAVESFWKDPRDIKICEI